MSPPIDATTGGWSAPIAGVATNSNPTMPTESWRAPTSRTRNVTGAAPRWGAAKRNVDSSTKDGVTGTRTPSRSRPMFPGRKLWPVIVMSNVPNAGPTAGAMPVTTGGGTISNAAGAIAGWPDVVVAITSYTPNAMPAGTLPVTVAKFPDATTSFMATVPRYRPTAPFGASG